MGTTDTFFLSIQLILKYSEPCYMPESILYALVDLQFVFENRLSITLPNGVKFNSHLCADDQRPAGIKACNIPAVFFYSSRSWMF